ncbi:hypothetical protein ACQ4PT_057972 [Festuca glaucescens]
MNCCLRNSRSLLLRCYKPAQPPISFRYHHLMHTAPPRSPLSEVLCFRPKASYHRLVSPPLPASDLLSQPSVRNPLNEVASDALWKEEIVPYTNRVHWVFPMTDCPDESRLAIDSIKKMYGDNILGPSHPGTVRVRLIVNDIIRGIHRVLLAKTPCDSSLNISDQNKKGKVAAVEPQTGHLRDLNWGVFVVKNKRVQAYSNWSGKLVIYTGMLDYFDTDAEIATILAHEIGHVVARHILELTQIVECLIPFLGKLLPFSRRQEIEADHIGLMLLAAAGFDPRVALGVHKKLGGYLRRLAMG